MSYPTPWTVQVLHFVPGQVDAYGNDVDTFGPPHAQRVIGWSPRGAGNSRNSREYDDDTSMVDTNLQMYVPLDFACEAQDRVILDGKLYTVEGDVEDYSKGPFGFEAGKRVNLRRVTG